MLVFLVTVTVELQTPTCTKSLVWVPRTFYRFLGDRYCYMIRKGYFHPWGGIFLLFLFIFHFLLEWKEFLIVILKCQHHQNVYQIEFSIPQIVINFPM